MDIAEYYENYWREKGDSASLPRLRFLAQYVDTDLKTLEINAGAGLLAKMLSDKGVEIEATELSHEGTRLINEKGVPAQQVDLDCEPLPYDDETFDCVVANSVIEHMFFHQKALAECVRVLRKGGKLVFCSPNIGHWRYRLWIVTGRFPYLQNTPTDESHLRFMTVRDARALCRSQGLKVIRTDGFAYVNSKLYPFIMTVQPFAAIYEKLARWYPSLFARDFVLICEKTR